MRERTRGERNARWIEDYCRVPHKRDCRVRLTDAEKHTVCQIYDGAAPLSAYLTLLHLCGPEGKQKDFRPDVHADIFTLWNAAGPDLRAYLKRDGARVVCAGLGTSYPPRAA
jgi:hypothetical protein